jgi:hypothetical protein
VSDPRAYTAEEAQQKYLDSFRQMTRYWAEIPNKTIEERCEGLAFSILVTLAGRGGLPTVQLTLNPHPDDREDAEACGDNWFDPGTPLDTESMMHACWGPYKVKLGEQ